jgi:Dyp-type peroxidase family
MPVPDEVRLPLRDIQGHVVRGYHMPFATHVFLHFDGKGPAKRWADAVRSVVTDASPWPSDGTVPQSAINVAFTWQGLSVLGVDDITLACLPEEFRAGMAGRAAELGDVGENAPATWEIGNPNAPHAVHALASVHAMTEQALNEGVKRVGAASFVGVRELYVQPTAALPGQTEHFGYRDGLSQPSVAGAGVDLYPGQGTPLPDGTWRAIRAGEFILGHEDEAGHGDMGSTPELLRNGSFLVLRKIRQHVARFREFLRETARRNFGSSDAAHVELLAAKFVGRWRSGSPLVLSHAGPEPALAADFEKNNDFRYAGDRIGLRAPLGSHIRRVNPRDALDGQDVVVSRHRLLRRGLPYGPWLAEGAQDDGTDRGIVFMALNASLSRQFEFVQRHWVNSGGFAGLGPNDRDPIAESSPSGAGSFLIPSEKTPLFLFDLPNFVTLRGGGYFFVPGLEALRRLAEEG